jgi:hypothetical protein
VRRVVHERFPDASDKDVDEALLDLRRQKRLKLISASDKSGKTSEQLEGGVNAVGENFVYAEPPEQTEPAPVQEAVQEQLDAEPEPVEQPAAEPTPEVARLTQIRDRYAVSAPSTLLRWNLLT